MSKTINEIAKELKISSQSLKQLIQDFDLNVSDCMTCNQDLKADFESFIKDHNQFIKDYNDDLNSKKSLDDVAKKIHQPINKLQEYINKQAPNIFENGYFKTSVSSYAIDKNLGGNYQFIYDYFGKKDRFRTA